MHGNATYFRKLIKERNKSCLLLTAFSLANFPKLALPELYLLLQKNRMEEASFKVIKFFEY